jgi:hypothetical protein
MRRGRENASGERDACLDVRGPAVRRLHDSVQCRLKFLRETRSYARIAFGVPRSRLLSFRQGGWLDLEGLHDDRWRLRGFGGGLPARVHRRGSWTHGRGDKSVNARWYDLPLQGATSEAARRRERDNRAWPVSEQRPPNDLTLCRGGAAERSEAARTVAHQRRVGRRGSARLVEHLGQRRGDDGSLDPPFVGQRATRYATTVSATAF